MSETTPIFAEEVVDLRTTSEMFQGKEHSQVTGRVLLHAVSPGSSGHGLCGREAGDLTAIGRPWDASYLPHLPRCGHCATAVAGGPPADSELPAGSAPPTGGPSSGVDVRSAHGSERENAGAEVLRAVLAEHDVRRWMFTDLVMVDEMIVGGFSHPMTFNPDLLLQRPARALTTFLHEQIHWLWLPGLDTATTEVSKRWPDPPPLPAGGHDAESSWLHLSVCALEYQSLGEVIGDEAATAELAQHKVYGWMYAQILGDPDWFAAFLVRHELAVPAGPPIPRRYYGEEWWKNLF